MIKSINPATLEVIGEVACVPPGEVEAAVVQARQVFEQSWGQSTFQQRARLVLAARRCILDNIDEIALTISRDNGKPLSEAVSCEIYPVCDLMSYFAKNSERLLRPRRIGIGIWNLMLRGSELHSSPKGVIGVISPWNYPFSIAVGEIAMALMAGNCVLHKASSSTPLVGRKIAEVFRAAGAPPGVFTDLPGDSSVGEALIAAGVDKILFTGSVEVGKKVMAAAAKTLTPVVLELGGKDPFIVLEDADLEVASSGAVWGAFTNSGQVCASVERVYVHGSVKDEFTRLVVEKTLKLRQGEGTRHDVDVGAMTTEGQLKKVSEHVEDARLRGAVILAGGERNKDLKGWFYKPTVLTNVDHSFPAVMEETFGPTMPIMSFKDDAEAVRLANDSPFGLCASVWTRDISRGRSLAKRIRAGTVAVNDCVYTHGICQTPWGGPGESGMGRTHSAMGLLEMVELRHIHVNRVTFRKDFWWFPYGAACYDLLKRLSRTLTTGDLSGLIRSLPDFVRLALLKKT